MLFGLLVFALHERIYICMHALMRAHTQMYVFIYAQSVNISSCKIDECTK